MKLVVTGALGHIGSRVIRELPAKIGAREVVMVDNLATARYCSLFGLLGRDGYRFVEGDVTGMDLSDVCRGAGVVLHLAALTDAAGSFARSEEVERVNLEASRRVGEACALAGTPMIHLSSTSVYGTQAGRVDESCGRDELRPQSPYAKTKLREEELLRELASTKGLRFVTCRFGTIAGVSPGMRFHTAVNKFCWQAVQGEPIGVWRTAMDQKRPYLSLGDAVEALAFIVRTGLFDGQVYNVLTENLTVRDIVESLEEFLGPVRIEYVDHAIMNQLSYEVGCTKVGARGFRSSGSIRSEIGATVAHLRGVA